MLKQTEGSQVQDETVQSNQMTLKPETIVVSNSDVLCGRGGLANRHPGNRMFRRIVEKNKELYQSTHNKFHKYFLTVSIIMAVEGKGGRFLKRDDKNKSTWVQISRTEAVSKTAQALREQDGKIKKSCATVESKIMNIQKKEKEEPERREILQRHMQQEAQPFRFPCSQDPSYGNDIGSSSSDSKFFLKPDYNIMAEVHVGIPYTSDFSKTAHSSWSNQSSDEDDDFCPLPVSLGRQSSCQSMVHGLEYLNFLNLDSLEVFECC